MNLNEKDHESDCQNRASDAADPMESATDISELSEAIERLARLPDTTYQTKRTWEATRLRVRVTVLDKKVKEARKQFEEELRRRARDREDSSPDPFLVEEDGVYYRVADEAPPLKICSTIHLRGRVRDQHGTGHSLLLGVVDPDGKEHDLLLPLALLAGDGLECRKELLTRGAYVPTSKKGKEKLNEYLLTRAPDKVLRQVDKPGWHDGVYVLAGEVFGETDESVYLERDEELAAAFAQSGTLEEWRSGVASLCVGNDYLTVAVSTSFGATLLGPCDMESGGLNYHGNESSGGKTSSQKVGASVLGNPPKMLRSCRTTDNALESMALAHHHAALFLDELGQMEPTVVGKATYMLGNGVGKARQSRDLRSRSVATWQILFLCSGEVGLESHMGEVGKAPRAGQDVRVLDIPVRSFGQNGIFKDLHGRATSREFVTEVVSNACRFYGTPIREFLRQLVALGPEGIRRETFALVEKFRAEYLPPGANGQVERALNRFGLIAAGGTMATRFGITGWPEDEAFLAAGRLFQDWVEQRGGAKAAETYKILAQVRRFFEAHGESRFTDMNAREGDYVSATRDRVGFREICAGLTRYYVLPEAYKNEICKGYDSKLVTKILIEHGILETGPKGESTPAHYLPDMGTKRVYCIGDFMEKTEEDATENSVASGDKATDSDCSSLSPDDCSLNTFIIE